MFTRRSQSIFAVLVLASLLLAACPAPAAAPAGDSAASSGGAASSDSGAAGGARELVWMVRNNNPTETKWETESAIPAWEKEHPDVKINLLSLVQNDIAVKREAMIAAGEPLHVWSSNWGGDGFASDRSRGLLTDLTPLIERDKFDTSVFLPDVFAIYQSEGKVWGLPFLTTGSYVFYNMSLFDEAKVPYPTTDWEDKSWTWDAMIDTAKKLTKNFDDPATAQYGIDVQRQNIEGPAMMFGQFPWTEDAYSTGFSDKIVLNTPEVIAAYQKHHDLVHVDKVSPDAASVQGLDQLGGIFQSGRVAMQLTGGWGWWVYSPVKPSVENGFCWGVAPIPWGSETADKRSVIYTDPWVITKGLQGQELDDSWEFVKFLVREDNARGMMLASGTPPTQKKLQEEWFKQFECMKTEDVIKVYQGAFARGRESSNHLLVKWDELNQIWTNALTPYFDDPQGDTAAVMAQLETDLNAALEKIIQEEKK